jgi:hypothetical protein
VHAALGRPPGTNFAFVGPSPLKSASRRADTSIARMFSPDVANSAIYAAICHFVVPAGAACGGVLLLFLRRRYRAARLDKLKMVAQYWARSE